MVRIALAGLGLMGKTHLQAYERLPGAQVVAVCDPRHDAVSALGVSVLGASPSAYAVFAEMLAAGGFDVVDICAPTHFHADYTVSALEAGFHVFCEKPMALTVADTERMLETAERTGRLLAVGQVLRYWPGYREVRALLESGRYGEVRSAELSRLVGVPQWSADNWMLDSRLSGSAALDLHIHDVDMVLSLFGAPLGVVSRGILEKDGSISQITTLYDFPHRVVQATGGWICAPAFGLRMRALFVLERAAIELVSQGTVVVTVHPEVGAPYALPLSDEDGYTAELRDFVEGIEKGRLSDVNPPRSAADAVALCLLEMESVRQKAEKDFPSSRVSPPGGPA